MTAARAWHLLTAAVAFFALGLQLVLVWQGHNVLDETNPPALGERLIRFVSYFTVLSNLLVAIIATTLALGTDNERPRWRVWRLNSVVCIAITAVVHWFALRPLLSLDGADWWADKLLHVVVPALAVLGWLAFGPRRRLQRGDLLPALAFPIAWLGYTLVRGAASGFYPYPFLDPDEHSYVVVAVNCSAVAVLFIAVAAGALALDRRLPTH